jgi:coenzyme F420 hydrogenase subunit beta
MAKQINSFFAQLLKKNWTVEKIQKYVGSFRHSYFCYATNPTFREKAASGGSTTALLAYLLQTGKIGGALVCRSYINDEGNVRPEFFIAETIEDLISAQGSKYSAVYFSSSAIPLIKEFTKKVAVVALPCDTKILRNSMQNDPALKEKVRFIITPFCGHNSEPVLTDQIIQKIRPDDKKLIDYRYRTGHWRGELQATFEDEQIINLPFSRFSDYQNLFFFSQRKCHHCFDHTGYYSDISVGDIWSFRMKNNPIKHTALITRSEAGDRLVSDAFETGILTGHMEPIEEICNGQARNMPTHYNISARAKLGRISQEHIKDAVHEKVRVNDFIVAALCLFNSRLSRSKQGKKIIFAIPRPFLKLYLFFIKFLESF